MKASDITDTCSVCRPSVQNHSETAEQETTKHLKVSNYQCVAAVMNWRLVHCFLGVLSPCVIDVCFPLRCSFQLQTECVNCCGDNTPFIRASPGSLWQQNNTFLSHSLPAVSRKVLIVDSAPPPKQARPCYSMETLINFFNFSQLFTNNIVIR